MRLPIVAVCLGWIALVNCQLATAQEPQWWTNQKKACGLSSSLDYNSWVQSGSPCSTGTAAPAAPAASTPQQQMGLALGKAAMPYLQQAVHDLFWGTPAKQPQPPDPAQQQRELAAQQLNNSGIYLLKQKNYAGAINEFQQALADAPDDPDILHNLALAKQQLKNVAVAAQTSGALSLFLGKAPANTGTFDFDLLTHSSVANPNASALNLVNLDPGVVDLRGVAGTSPESLKSQIDGLLTNHDPTSPPSDPLVVLPQAQDIELLFQPPPKAKPSQWPGPQRPANSPYMVNNPSDESTAKSLAELDKVLDTKADQDLQRQFDWFNKVYLPAHPELQNAQPATSGAQPHN